MTYFNTSFLVFLGIGQVVFLKLLFVNIVDNILLPELQISQQTIVLC